MTTCWLPVQVSIESGQTVIDPVTDPFAHRERGYIGCVVIKRDGSCLVARAVPDPLA